MLKYVQPVLEILDEGVGMYRSAFSSFMLLAAIWTVPLIIGLSISFWGARFLNDGQFTLLLLGWMLLAVPLAVYMVGSLSRAAQSVRQQQTVRLSEVLAIPPLRAAGMGCYGVIMLMIANMATSLVSMICICPLYIGLIFTFSGMFGLGGMLGDMGTVIGVFLVLIMLLLFIVLYGLGLVLSGAAYSTTIYGLQPFLQQQPFARSIRESIDLLAYRFGNNILVFLGSSLVFGALSISVTIAVSLLLPLPLILALGAESLLARGVGASAWMLGVLMVLPLLPIWMSLLYQRNVHAREGHDLAWRIAERYPPADQPEALETEGYRR